MLRKSVKLGITRAIPVTQRTIIVLATIDFTRCRVYEPFLKKSACSIMSKAHSIWTGYETKALTQMHAMMKVVKGVILKDSERIEFVCC
jgi:hypothetical protein